MGSLVCVKTGSRYSAAYVNRLSRALHRHGLVEPLTCITDDPTGLDLDIHKVSFPASFQTNSFWDKLYVFSWDEGHRLTADRLILLDIDMLIIDDIRWLVEFGNNYDQGFATCSRFDDPAQINSTIMCIPNGFGKKIWQLYNSHPDYFRDSYKGDSNFIESVVGSATLRLEDVKPGFLKSYKRHIAGKGVPEGTAVISFHGRPDMEDVFYESELVRENWK